MLIAPASTPIEQRKAKLARLLRVPRPGIVLNAHYDGDGEIVFAHACKLVCEGIVSKRLGSLYRSGRSPHWLKVKNPKAAAVACGRDLLITPASRSATARDRVINDQHNDCSDNGHDNAADINTGYAGAT